MIYRFDDMALDTRSFLLSRGGAVVSVEPQVFDLLVYLIQNRDRVVTRNELLGNLWKGKVVSDSALSARLKAARKAVGDTGSEQRIIKTIHGRGYQFAAAVTVPQGEPAMSNRRSLRVTKPVLAAPETPSIAVQSFQNLSGDAEQNWFADGMTAAIVNALSRVSNLFVVADYSIAVSSNAESNRKQLAKEQGVQFMLTGSILKQAERVRVTAQLTDVDSGLQRWADRYDRQLDDIFAVQDDITRNIVVALQIQLAHGEIADTWATGTNSVEAWICLVRGFEALDKQRKHDLIEARKMAQTAIELDPNYVSAWVLLAFCNADDANWEWTGRRAELMKEGFYAARRGIQIEPGNVQNLAVLAYLHLMNQEFDQALELAERAVACGPHDLDALGISSVVLSRTGHVPDAIDRIKRAIRHCPVYPTWITLQLGVCYLLSAQPELAVATLQAGVGRVTGSPECLPWLIVSLIEAGDIEEARKSTTTLLQIEPSFRAGSWHLADFQDNASSTRYRNLLTKAGVPA